MGKSNRAKTKAKKTLIKVALSGKKEQRRRAGKKQLRRQ